VLIVARCSGAVLVRGSRWDSEVRGGVEGGDACGLLWRNGSKGWGGVGGFGVLRLRAARVAQDDGLFIVNGLLARDDGLFILGGLLA
jgi:hypothetical protein